MCELRSCVFFFSCSLWILLFVDFSLLFEDHSSESSTFSLFLLFPIDS